MERYVDLLGPFRFMIIYSSVYAVGMFGITYLVLRLLSIQLSKGLYGGLSLLFFLLGLWIGRKHVLLTEE